ncbi:pyruvate kinase [Pasteurella multocida]|uniref:pyruvate kinase n=1 Tax=Pasteurella multocida TaxID=747 RepID=UPI002C0C445B|nr:pyruvate kinase [Pasteurella multocida]MEB3492862.1 pyruvate kinase [Pasteurella multocida]
MKPFDLEKALAGEPVVLRDGGKAFVKFEVPKELRANNFADIVGFKISGNEFIVKEWDSNGAARFSCGYEDIIGMYEEPRPTVTLTLPCPLKEIEEGQEFWHMIMDSDPLSIAWAKVDVSMSVFDKENIYHLALLEAGLAFKSEEDAQAWLDAMKNAWR